MGKRCGRRLAAHKETVNFRAGDVACAGSVQRRG